MVNPLKAQSRVSGVHDIIRADVLKGLWRPGDKMQPVLLAKHYDTSTTVIREALTRLAGEEFVTIEPYRGFFVPRLSLEELKDITEVRSRHEALGIELAIERGDLTWESELMASHYQLSRTPRRVNDDPEHVSDEWIEAHRSFHAKLMEASGVPILRSLARQLSDATDLYRRWAAPSPAAVSRDVESEHREILEATIKRDAKLASSLLRAHYEKTLEVLVKSGLVDGVAHTA